MPLNNTLNTIKSQKTSFSYHSYHCIIVTLQRSAGACSRTVPHVGPCPPGCEAQWTDIPGANASGADWCPSPHGSRPADVQCPDRMLCNPMGSPVVAVQMHIIKTLWQDNRKHEYRYPQSLPSNPLHHTGLFISPSGISELDCATTKTDTAERSISIGRESLFVSQRTGSHSAGISCTIHELFCL